MTETRYLRSRTKRTTQEIDRVEETERTKYLNGQDGM